MKRGFWIICFILLFPISTFGSEWNQGDLYAVSAVLADGENGRILYGENENEFRSIASTTKIMTAIIALEQGEMEQICTVSKYAASMPNVKLGIQEGEQYYLRDLLYAVMLESDNDAAVAVAETIGGSVERFAQSMNEKAKEIGAHDTHFVTPNGLDADGQGATASDLAKIASYAIKNKDFCELINTRKYKFSSMDGKRSFHVSNKNAFLDQMEGAFGIKTGYTGEAGYCFVGAVKEGERTFISVVLGSSWPPNKNAKWQDTKKLITYGLENYYKKNVLKEEEVRRMVQVIGGTRDFVLAVGGRGYDCLMGENERAGLNYRGEFIESAPLNQGEKVGRAQLYVGETMVMEQEVYLQGEVEKGKRGTCFLNIFWHFFSFQGVL